MDDLHASGFRQRIFLRQSRGGQLFKVGLPCQHVSIRERKDTNGSLWDQVSRAVEAQSTPEVGAMRRINGPELNPPIDFSPGPEQLPISPIDASIALAHRGGLTIWKELDDPRPADEWQLPLAQTGDNPRLRDLLNRGRPSEDLMVLIHEVLTKGPGRLLVNYLPTPEGIRKYWQSEKVEENSYHSSIVSNHYHSQMVTAYDLALGEPIFWSDKEENFNTYICELADWRIKSTDPPKPQDKIIPLSETGFFQNELQENKNLIIATSEYYCNGTPPIQVKSAKTASELSLILNETTR
jgi:hypothetical protein